MEAYRTGTVVVVEDCASDPLGRSLVSREIGIDSVIVAPLAVAQGPFMAVFFSWRGRKRVFIQAEIDFVTRAATTTTAAMNDARLYQELSERERFAAALNEISAAITSLLDYDEILTRVVGRAAAALGAESSAVSMLEDDAWVPRYVHAATEDVLGRPIPRERVGYANVGVQTKQVVAVDDCATDPRVDHELQRMWGVRAVMMAPLIVRDDVIGGIFFNHHSGPHAFSALEVQFTANVAAIISGALETARLYEGERHVATTLQEAFIHPLPDVPGLEFAVTAQRAYEPDLVGGDFYDAFDLGDGRAAVLVGDVEGKGVRAAGLTETVRSAVRALALVDASPGFILGKTNELLLAARQAASSSPSPCSWWRPRPVRPCTRARGIRRPWCSRRRRALSSRPAPARRWAPSTRSSRTRACGCARTTWCCSTRTASPRCAATASSSASSAPSRRPAGSPGGRSTSSSAGCATPPWSSGAWCVTTCRSSPSAWAGPAARAEPAVRR